MKRLFGISILALTLALSCFALAGCGSSEKDSSSETDNPQAAAPVEQQAEKGPVALPLSDSTSASVEGDYQLTRPVYHKDAEMEPNEFCLSDYCSQGSLDEGWYYYYANEEGDSVPYLQWPNNDSCYPARITVLFTNLKNEPVDLSKRISGAITYNSGGEDEELIDCTLFQLNPGQKDSEGFPIVNTTVFHSVQPGETVQFGFFADIPRAELDSDKPLVLAFSIDDGARYEIDLRAEIQDFNFSEDMN